MSTNSRNFLKGSFVFAGGIFLLAQLAGCMFLGKDEEYEPKNIKEIKSIIRSEESAVRYWGVTGMLVLGEHSREAFPILIQAL